MQLSDEQTKTHQLQIQTIAQTGHFYRKFNASRKDNTEMAAFDSLEQSDIPDTLQTIFDNIGSEPANREAILNGIGWGIQAYKERNGGDEPTELQLAYGLSAGAALFAKDKQSRNAFDNIDIPAFDNLYSDHHEALSVVPALTVVTIAMAIANSLPVIAQLPNPMGSNEVPLVNARFVADKNWGGLKKGDYLDGPNASRVYTLNRFRYKMDKGAGNLYSVTPYTAYADYENKVPDTNSTPAPFYGGRVSIRVNGKEVGHTRSRDNNKKGGVVSVTAVEQSYEVAGVEVKLASGTANLDTKLINVTFTEDLPVAAVVEAMVVLDFELEENDKPVILPPGVDITTDYGSVFASPHRTRITASIDSITQMANEMNVGFVGAALAIVQGKFYLEQAVSLLQEAKERAEYNGRSYDFRANRGVAGNLAAAWNSSGDLMKEFRKTLDFAVLGINQAAGTGVNTFDLFVSSRGAILLRTLPGDVFTPTSTPFGVHGQIVRIGSFNDGTNVYYAPDSTGLLNETATSVEALLIARSAEPAKSTIVGHTPVPPMILEGKPDPFKTVLGIYARVAGELNPIDRYADQAAVINLLDLPRI